ncbi:unnamed protein product [Ectocarpus fasciculatus]
MVIDASLAERYVEDLKTFRVEDIGNAAWMAQHQSIEKLNLQAHQSAMTNSDEYVLESILTFNKIPVLLNDLLAIEAWKDFVYPKLLSDVAGKNSMRVYFILYHEATLVNLFEVMLYHKHICAAIGESMLELVDYVARKMTKLNGGYTFRERERTVPSSASDSAGLKEFVSKLETDEKNPKDELAQYHSDIEFRVCVSACACARMICEHAEDIPLSAVSRITDTHDLLVLIIPLIENPPWTRRLSDGTWQKMVDFSWSNVEPIDLLTITKLEGQPWLMLYHLLAKEVFRERYHLNGFRKGQLLRVRKYLNDVLLDQLPILADIQRYMDELAITEVPDHSSAGSVFMFQQVSVVRETIIKDRDWDAVAAYQLSNVFTMTDRTDTDLHQLADMYADESVSGVLGASAADDA